jgi:hypothetical protein
MIVSCSCGTVQFEALGPPIIVVACYCDDCQQGARQIQALPHAPLVQDPDGGTPYLLYRKDRLRCSRGAELLRDLRLRETSPTRRVVASCCHSGMYLDFQKGHWLCIYRSRFAGEAPAVQMHIQTRFRPAGTRQPAGVPESAGHSLTVVARLLAARLAMLLGR